MCIPAKKLLGYYNAVAEEACGGDRGVVGKNDTAGKGSGVKWISGRNFCQVIDNRELLTIVLLTRSKHETCCCHGNITDHDHFMQMRPYPVLTLSFFIRLSLGGALYTM